MKIRPRRGASMLEMAFVLPAMLMLIVGAVEMGRGVWTYTTLAHAARQGARFALTQDVPDREAVAERVARAAVGLEIERLEVTLAERDEPADSLEIGVRYPFDFVGAALIGAGDGLILESRARIGPR